MKTTRKTTAKAKPARVSQPLVASDASKNWSATGTLSVNIRQAAEFLIQKREYSLQQLQWLTSGADADGEGGDPSAMLHKNSVMKIKDLEIRWAIQLPVDPVAGELYELKLQSGKLKKHEHKPRVRWVEASMDEHPTGYLNTPGRMQWMWNPQVDTFEKLERILAEAERLGYKRHAEATPRSQAPTASRRAHVKAA